MFQKSVALFFRTLLPALIMFCFFACKPGEVGPKGDTGNADVMQFSYGSRTYSSSSITYTLTGVTADVINKSAVFVYLQNASGFWYPIPGIYEGNYEYRINIRPSATNSAIALIRVGTTSISVDTFQASRIVIIPANDLKNGRKAAVDYANYEAVKAFYNLPD